MYTWICWFCVCAFFRFLIGALVQPTETEDEAQSQRLREA